MTGKEARNYLIDVIDFPDNDESIVNRIFTKEEIWELFFSMVKDIEDEEIINETLAKNILKEFSINEH